MNHAQHKFFTATVVFLMTIIGVTIAAQFKEVSLGVLNMGLLLVNASLLLIIIGILLQVKEDFTQKTKKRG